MAILTTVFSFFTIHILVLVTSAKADPQAEVHPSEIMPGITSSLDINCSFFSMDHLEMANFASLILSRANSSDQEFEDLAAVTQFSPDSVTVLTEEKLTATGVYSQMGESFIQVTWKYPTATQGGVYQCVAHGLDILGECLELVTTSTVTVVEANLNDILEKLRQMEIHETAMETSVVNMDKRMLSLEYNSSQMSSYITDLEDTVARLHRFQIMTVIGTFENHEYYVSKEGYGEINNVIRVCKFHGGYLAEIDNESEFNAIKRFVNNTSGFDWVILAGTDEASDGTWILQSNQQPLPFTSWYTSGASTGTTFNCLGLRGDSSWNMDDYSCKKDPPRDQTRYMCEIPRV